MSYLVLARKWRPKRFAELVGQEHVVRALTNALDAGRVHHAFLFTGTRGVGKTTIARIFAKSLNCEQGTSADPCGVCNSCRDIDAGRFIDLLEIDAASNTGVDDVREVIDNAQYMPSRGRVKVYLIDEVHMLSKSAFNALLKTLEEPPGHVKFLLATTDPQKLPVTVLSRCLQFNLKRLDEGQIGGQMSRILEAEGIAVEAGAIRQLSRAADGSLRDGLSLLDQAIAYAGAGGEVALGDAAVATMLGTVDRARVGAVLAALAEADGPRLLAEVATLAEFSPDWNGVLDALAEALHRVQVRQLVPGVDVEADGVDVDAIAGAVPAGLVQLWYQMALQGRRDLPLAPSPRAGFEMVVLRMLAFRPEAGGGDQAEPARKAGDAAAAARAALGRPAQAGATLSPPASAPRTAAVPATPAPEMPAQAAARVMPVLAPSAGRDAAAAVTPVVLPRSTPITVQRAAAPERERPREVAAPGPSDDLAAGRGAAMPPATRMAEPASTTTGSDAHASTQLLDAARPAPVDAERSADVAPSFAPATARIADADAWADLVAASGLRGPARVLAEHAAFIDHDGDVLRLSLPDDDAHLKAPNLVAQVAEAIAPRIGGVPQIRFDAAAAQGGSLRERNERARDARQASAEATFLADADVQRLIREHGATVVPDSIRPLDEP